jgi:LysR family transcriptional regulator, benzoate and cis,cis-muconate-responsive activator of ben and cat genes
MELRQLRYFVAVAEEGNISRAGKRLFLTQPALSRQIQALEHEVGHPLLERKAHAIQLTRAGETLLHEAREVLQRADLALERTRTASSETRLRVGYAPSLATGILSTAIANFTQAHQHARVELSDLSTVETLEALRQDRIDVAIAIARLQDKEDFVWTTLLREPWRVAVPHGHPLTRKRSLRAEDLKSGPLVLFCKKGYPEYWEHLAPWLREHRLRPRIAGEYDGAESLMAAVEGGLGIALVGARMARLFPGRVSFKTLTDPPETLCIAAARQISRTADKPLAVFISELVNAAKLLSESGAS